VYHSYAKVHGKLVRKSLKTKSLQIAKLKLDKLLADERAKCPVNDEDWRFKQLIDTYQTEIEANYLLKPRSKAYRLETVKMIRKNWPGLDAMNPRNLSEKAVQDWASRMAGRYSPSRFNGAVAAFSGILKLGMARGIVG